VAVPFLYLLKIIFTKAKAKKKTFACFIIALALGGLAYLAYEYFVRQSNVIYGLLSLFWSLFAPRNIVAAATGGGGGGGKIGSTVFFFLAIWLLY
jgi:hypothetical protein